MNNSGQQMSDMFIRQSVYTWNDPVKRAIQIGLGVFFLLGGVLHFVLCNAFARIVPPFLPLPEVIVLITGVIELGFAIALWLQIRLRLTGVLLGAYLLAVLPANIYMAVAGISVGSFQPGAWIAWGRVALQFPLIALVLWSTHYRSASPVSETRRE